MQTADLEEFETLLGTLCAAFEEPLTPTRKKAYFTTLAKMSVAQFSRCIDFALSQQGPDDLPTPKGIWKIYRQLRAPGASGVQTSAHRGDDPEHLTYFANRLLFAHLGSRQGLGSERGEASPELAACLAFKRQLLTDWCGFIREGDELATPAQFMSQWIASLQRVSRIEKSTHDDWLRFMDAPDALKPFPPSMGRELKPLQTDLPELA